MTTVALRVGGAAVDAVSVYSMPIPAVTSVGPSFVMERSACRVTPRSKPEAVLAAWTPSLPL